MKHSRFRTGIRALMVACFAATSPLALAQDNYLVDNFDGLEDYLNWGRWWGSAAQSYTDGEGMDAEGNTDVSASLKAEVVFDYATHGGDNQFALVRYFDGVIDGTLYTNLVFQLYWDGASPKNAGGNFGTLEVGFVANDYSQITPLYYSVPADTADQWILVECPMDPATPGIETIRGVFLKIWAGNEDSALTGNATFWVDDVMLLADTSTGPPPVEVAMAPANPGLQIFASEAGNPWQRQNIRTQQTDPAETPNNYSWVGKTGPTSYALTLSAFPAHDALDNTFQAHMFLVPENGMQYGIGDTAQDWNATNVIFVTITANDQGEGIASFRYKTDGPGHDMINNTDPLNGPVGHLGDLTDVSPLGTWTFTFENDTDVTVTGPGGATANYTLPAADAARFADPMITYFGIQPNNVDRVGLSGTYSRIQISGSGTTLDDSFEGTELNPDLWAVVAGNASGITLVPADAVLWLQWNAPATGHVLQTSNNLLGPWTTPDLPVLQIGTKKSVLVPQSALPTPIGFLRTQKPADPAP